MGWNQNRVTELLKIDYPIFQAPMAGGATTVELVSQTSECGGLGNIGAGYMSPMDIGNSIQEIRKATNRTFGINLFVSEEPDALTETKVNSAIAALSPYKNELEIAEDIVLPQKDHLLFYEEQLEAVMKAMVPVCSFTFGIPHHSVIEKLKQECTVVIGTATNVEEALLWEKNGADIVVAQGSEAGGHRGTFLNDDTTGLVGGLALIPQVVDAVQIPVIAAGGIMDARGIAAAFMLGAEGVQLGTAFLTAEESGIHLTYKDALLNTNGETSITKAFSGKMARGITNRYMREMADKEILPFPYQNDLTNTIRKRAASKENPDFMSLWAGQAVKLAEQKSVQQLMNEWIEGTGRLLD